MLGVDSGIDTLENDRLRTPAYGDITATAITAQGSYLSSPSNPQKDGMPPSLPPPSLPYHSMKQQATPLPAPSTTANQTFTGPPQTLVSSMAHTNLAQRCDCCGANADQGKLGEDDQVVLGRGDGRDRMKTVFACVEEAC